MGVREFGVTCELGMACELPLPEHVEALEAALSSHFYELRDLMVNVVGARQVYYDQIACAASCFCFVCF